LKSAAAAAAAALPDADDGMGGLAAVK